MNNIHARLRNWGIWLNYDADVGPKYPKCISLESTHVAELGEVHADEINTLPVPNVADAEKLNAAIQRLNYLERYCISVRYGGLPSVIKFKRIGDHVMEAAANRAEKILSETIK